ncbi:hypothetical protein [Aeromicrobium sp. NPDC092404]|uniref:hypothetical protein n=1 Tax=Aeromicrobium sp. NPDC092404 TaxID=3154976 RepID=UPI003427702A
MASDLWEWMWPFTAEGISAIGTMGALSLAAWTYWRNSQRERSSQASMVECFRTVDDDDEFVANGERVPAIGQLLDRAALLDKGHGIGLTYVAKSDCYVVSVQIVNASDRFAYGVTARLQKNPFDPAPITASAGVMKPGQQRRYQMVFPPGAYQKAKLLLAFTDANNISWSKYEDRPMRELKSDRWFRRKQPGLGEDLPEEEWVT